MTMLDRRVRSFLAVARCGSFSAAARELYCSQPALSKQVAQLEHELGVELLDRSGYRATPTEAGRYLQREATAMERHERRVLAQLATYAHHTVRIGFTGSFENRALLAALQDVKRAHEGLSLEFVKCTFEESLRRLQEGDVDLCFGIEATFRQAQGIACRPLFAHRICVICSFDHPLAAFDRITPDQLADEELVVLSRAFGTGLYRDFMRACRLDGLAPRVKKEVDLFDELVFAVSIGEGVAIVSQEVVRPTEVHVAELVGSHHTSTYVVAYREGDASAAALLVADEVTALFAHSSGDAAADAPGKTGASPS